MISHTQKLAPMPCKIWLVEAQTCTTEIVAQQVSAMLLGATWIVGTAEVLLFDYDFAAIDTAVKLVGGSESLWTTRDQDYLCLLLCFLLMRHS